MATYNLNTTASVDLLSSDISASQETTFSIANPLSNSSYFTFETVRNSDGFYDSSSPKNMAGTYSLGAGLSGVVKSDYIASVIVRPGGGDLTFTPDNYISGSSLNLRGTSSPPAPTGTSFDADYQAILDYATTQGYTLPSSGQQVLQNQLVVDLKDAGVWSKLDLFYVFATDGDSDFASINWKDPNNHEITEFNSPTFTTNQGWSTDGTSSYLNTNYNFSTDSNNYTQNDAGVFVGFSEMDTSNYSGDAFFGTLITSRFTTVRVDQNSLNSANRLWINQSTQSDSMFNSKGDNHIYFGNRTSSSDINSRTTQLSTNTTDTQTATQTSTALTNDTLALLGWSSGFMNSLHKMSIFGLSSNLSSTEMDDICTAWYTNYFTNL